METAAPETTTAWKRTTSRMSGSARAAAKGGATRAKLTGPTASALVPQEPKVLKLPAIAWVTFYRAPGYLTAIGSTHRKLRKKRLFEPQAVVFTAAARCHQGFSSALRAPPEEPAGHRRKRGISSASRAALAGGQHCPKAPRQHRGKGGDRKGAPEAPR